MGPVISFILVGFFIASFIGVLIFVGNKWQEKR